MVFRVALNFPNKKTKGTSKKYRLEDMNEMMFEIYIENQIDRIDRSYMSELITDEEYVSKMNELRKIEEEFYNNLK